MSITQHLTNTYFRISRLPVIKWRPVEAEGYDLYLEARGPRRKLPVAQIYRLSGNSKYKAYYCDGRNCVNTETATQAGAQLFIAQQFKKFNP